MLSQRTYTIKNKRKSNSNITLVNYVKVMCKPSYLVWHHKLCFFLCRLQNLKRAHQVIIHTHHCTSIVKFTTVVWSWKYRNKLPVSEEFIPILYNLHKNLVSIYSKASYVHPCIREAEWVLSTKDSNLMSTTNEIQVMLCQKFSHLIRAKGVGHSSVIHSPTLHIPTRIRPKQITEQASVGNCSRTDYIPDFIQVCEFRGKTTMHAQYFIIY